jgi:hypothetical protein
MVDDLHGPVSSEGLESMRETEVSWLYSRISKYPRARYPAFCPGAESGVGITRSSGLKRGTLTGRIYMALQIKVGER